MTYKIRSWLTFYEEVLANETGRVADGKPLRKIVIAAAIRNPHAGRFRDVLAIRARGFGFLREIHRRIEIATFEPSAHRVPVRIERCSGHRSRRIAAILIDDREERRAVALPGP